MEIDFEKVRIFIRPGSTDMRKQINTLAAHVEETMKKSSLNGDLYLFCGKDRSRIKVLYWDRNGFCLWQKRLEKDRFPWPKGEEDARELTAAEFRMLLRGIDFFHAHREVKYSSVS